MAATCMTKIQTNNSKKRKNGRSDGSPIKLLKQRQSANIQIDHSKKSYDNESESTSSNIPESELIRYNKKVDRKGYRRLKLNSRLNNNTGRIVKSGTLLNVLNLKIINKDCLQNIIKKLYINVLRLHQTNSFGPYKLLFEHPLSH